MKGIILAGGSGTRLWPITKGISKQLMPIYDKPMIYYPLSTLMQAGIREILIITASEDNRAFQSLLGDGSRWGIRLEYIIQPSPDGIGQAFIIGEKFLAGDKVCLILGDNLYHGHHLGEFLQTCTDPDGGIVFGIKVHDPERYAVAEFDEHDNVISTEEKPAKPKSEYAIPGLYFYDNNAVRYAKESKPSARGELEITEIHNAYLRENKLKIKKFDEGDVWLDTGTIDSLTDAADFVRVMQKRTGKIIGSPEMTAYEQNFITTNQLAALAEPLKKSGYGMLLV